MGSKFHFLCVQGSPKIPRLVAGPKKAADDLDVGGPCCITSARDSWMSADPVALQALAVRAKTQLRYFELVNFSAAEHNVKCFMAVGKHALYLIRRNLGGLYPTEEGGKIFFAFIRSMVEDEDNATDLLLLLSESGALAWKSEKLFVSCDNRHALAQRIQVAWNTDYVFRFGQVRHLHLTKQSLRGERGESKQTISLTVKPFNGCKQVLHHGYRFFVPQSYKDQDSVAQWRLLVSLFLF